MSYTQVFGGTTIYPSDVSYLALTLSANATLQWPLESNDPTNPAARIIDVTASGAYSVLLPDATLTGAGQTMLFNNLSGSSSSFTVKDYDGNTIATVAVGEQWQVYLASVSTTAGTWRVFRYGASTATVQASALAGYGLTVTSSTLSQSLPVTTFTVSPRTLLVTDRASALVWSGTGTGTLNLLGAATLGNNFFLAVRNSGGGDFTIDPAGSETIDGDTTLVLRPGDSANLMTDGLTWFTLGLGQEAVFAFDYTSIAVTGGTYTLSGAELNRIAYNFVGALGSDQYIVVPSTVQQYWVDNATTGAYTFYLQTSGGTPLPVTQGARGIYYCNGAEVVNAATAALAVPISASQGGTGLTTYAVGDLIYASAVGTLSRRAAVASGNALLSQGVGVAPVWGAVVTPSTANTFTATQTLGGGTSTPAVVTPNIVETETIVASPATGTINYDLTTQSVLWYTTASSANWTLNFRASAGTPMNTMLSTGQTISCAFKSTQGATGYYASSIQVDGTAVGVTIKWQGGAPTVGGTSAIDAYTFSITKTAASTYTILATRTAFI